MHKKNIMKKLILIIAWVLLTSITEDETEWYVEFYSDDNSTHRIGRDRYNEAIELIGGSDDEKHTEYYMLTVYNESLRHTKELRCGITKK